MILHLYRLPVGRWTVWGALPCNRGLEKPDKCPRLGWLPLTKGCVIQITALYFQKHAQTIWNRKLPLLGKRIFIRLRQEMDEGAALFEQVSAVVPGPEPRA